jgi:hypothetical protein
MKLNIIGVLFAAGVGLAVANPTDAIGAGPPLASPTAAQEAGHGVDKGQLSALRWNNDPDIAIWVLPALFIACFAAGYGVRSLVSYQRHSRARSVRYSNLPSDRTLTSDPQLKADNIVPHDDAGDLRPLQRPPATRPRQSS